jgi:U3 small nucleolar RNA-associated protein 12
MALNTKIVRKKIQIFALLGSMKICTVSLVLKNRKLSLEASSFLKLNDEPIGMKTNPNGDYLLISLMDNSLHIRHTDTLKLHLKIYGHSLPITDFDCSSDEYLLATVSSDKSLRIWDKDFGNCRRIINKCHDVAPTQIRILKDTHYALTTGKDQFVKFWDLDTFELVMRFECLGDGSIGALALSSIGHFFIIGTLGKSLRKFTQTREQVLANDTNQEIQDETGVLDELEEGERKDQYYAQKVLKTGKNRATRLKKFEVLKGAEELMDLLEAIDKECKSDFSQFETKVLDNVKESQDQKLCRNLLGKRGKVKKEKCPNIQKKIL